MQLSSQLVHNWKWIKLVHNWKWTKVNVPLDNQQEIPEKIMLLKRLQNNYY